MKKIYKYRIVVAIILGLVTTAFVFINLDKNMTDFYTQNYGNNILYVVLFVLYSIMIEKVLTIKDKRANIVALIIAVILSLFEIIGNSISQYMDLSGIFTNGNTFLKSFLKFIGYVITIYGIVVLLITKVFPKLEPSLNKGKKFFTNNKRSFFIVAGIIFIAYIPYLLNEYPGIISPDSCIEIMTGLGYVTPISNHHPVFHALIISIAMNIGKLIGNYTTGIAIYSIMQMIFTACVFSYTIYYMAKKNINIWLRVICLVFFAFYPPFAAYSVTMWKDVPFGLMMMLFTIDIIELITNKEEFLKSKRKNITFTIIMILTFLFRNNGIYVVVLTMPFMILASKDYRKRMSIICVIVILSYIIVKGPIFSILNIKEGGIKETLSVPLQQFARITKYQGDKLTDEERWAIYEFLPVENLGQLYNPELSDPVKSKFNNEAWENDKLNFFKLWGKLCLKYPKDAIESFLCNSYGYWYPEAKGVVISYDFVDYTQYKNIFDEELAESIRDIKYEKSPIVKIQLIDDIKEGIDNRNIPVVSLLFSIGLYVWMLIICMGYVIYKKKYRYLLAYIPMIMLWLTTLASPVACEYRYIYSLFTCFPLLSIGIISMINKQKNSEKEEAKGDLNGNNS